MVRSFNAKTSKTLLDTNARISTQKSVNDEDAKQIAADEQRQKIIDRVLGVRDYILKFTNLGQRQFPQKLNIQKS